MLECVVGVACKQQQHFYTHMDCRLRDWSTYQRANSYYFAAPCYAVHISDWYKACPGHTHVITHALTLHACRHDRSISDPISGLSFRQHRTVHCCFEHCSSSRPDQPSAAQLQQHGFIVYHSQNRPGKLTSAHEASLVRHEPRD